MLSSHFLPLTEKHDLWELWKNRSQLRRRSLRNLISPVVRHPLLLKCKISSFQGSDKDVTFTSELTSKLSISKTMTSLEDPLGLQALLEGLLAGQAWELVGDDSGNRTCPKMGSAAPSVSC